MIIATLLAGALICPTMDAATNASNARDYGWRYVAGAGMPQLFAQGSIVTPASFGCRLSQGEIITVGAGSFTYAQTSAGWVQRRDLKIDAPPVEKPKNRPQLCSRDGCVYTDVSPYEAVPKKLDLAQYGQR